MELSDIIGRCLPIFNQKVGYGASDRDRDYAVTTFKFNFKFQLPNPRKERIIFKRDEFGRIVSSKPRQLSDIFTDIEEHGHKYTYHN